MEMNGTRQGVVSAVADMPRVLLDELADAIRLEHQTFRQCGQSAAQHAFRAGELLAASRYRDDIPDGGWALWVRRKVGIPMGTVYLYMRLHKVVASGTSNLEAVARWGLLRAVETAENGPFR
jgi:hypothetical protein